MAAVRTAKPVVAVHKFSSCDGCQLAFLNLGEQLLTLFDLVDVRHFVEAGLIDTDAEFTISFIEGSVSTADEQERIGEIRARSKYLVTIGACATSGGIQALRNLAAAAEWTSAVYASPQYIDSLDRVTPIREHVKVDLELWGCPVTGRQVIDAVRALLFGVLPAKDHDKVCMACKRAQAVCVLVTGSSACMGPVTQSGCGALCPRFGRDCYGCYGPGENPNTDSLGRRFAGLGLVPEQVAHRFLTFNNAAPAFNATGLANLKGK